MAEQLALTDFDSYEGSSGAAAVVLDPFDGIDGTSILWVADATASRRRLLVPADASGVTKGLLRGQMRVATQRSAADLIHMYGLSIGHSVDDVTVAATNCYTLSLFKAGGGGAEAHRVRLTKHSAGLSTNGVRLTHFDFAETAGVVTMQLIWDLTATAANFEVFTGTALDYSDLVSRFTFIDSTAPLTVSVAEGVFFRTPDNASIYSVWMDNLEVDELL